MRTELQARCSVTDADSKHSIDQTPMLGKSLLSFSYLDMEKDFKQVARGTSPTCPAFLNLLSRTTSWSGSHAMYLTPSGRKRGEVQRNMSTGWSLVSTSTWDLDLISTGRDLKANIPLIEHPFLCLMMIQPAISMHGISGYNNIVSSETLMA